jgi:hypothetical protein
MIRRGFWLTAGAVTGIYGYRRVSAIGHRLSSRLNPAGPAQQAQPAQHAQLAQQARPAGDARLAQGARLARRGSRGAIGVARETYRFTRDVREGMELYMARHSAPAGSTLGARDPETARDLRTDDDPRPKDGH